MPRCTAFILLSPHSILLSQHKVDHRLFIRILIEFPSSPNLHNTTSIPIYFLQRYKWDFLSLSTIHNIICSYISVSKHNFCEGTYTTREIKMREGNRVASVTLFTFTLKLGPHAHSLCEARPPCSLSWCNAPTSLLTQLTDPSMLGYDWPVLGSWWVVLANYVKTTYICTILCHKSQLHHSWCQST